MTGELPVTSHEQQEVSQDAVSIPALVETLVARDGEYGPAGMFESIRGKLIDDLEDVRRHLELLGTKQTIAQNNSRSIEAEIEQKIQELDSPVFHGQPTLLARHEASIHALYRAKRVVRVQLETIAQQMTEGEKVAAELQEHIANCEANRAQFYAKAMVHAALLREALAELAPIDTFTVTNVDNLFDDDTLADVTPRPESLAGSRVIIDISDIVERKLADRPIGLTPAPVETPPPRAADDMPTEVLRPVAVTILPPEDDGLFGN